MSDRLSRDVVGKLKEKDPEKQRKIVDAAARMTEVKDSVAAMSAVDRLKEWYNFYAPVAEQLRSDINEGVHNRKVDIEKLKWAKEVCQQVIVGQGYMGKYANGDGQQLEYAKGIYNRYKGSKGNYQDKEAWDQFKDLADRTVEKVRSEYELAERETKEQEVRKEREERDRILRLVIGDDPRDIAFAMEIDKEVGKSGQGERVVCKLIAPNGTVYRASTTEDVGYRRSNGIINWILTRTERMMSGPQGGLRAVSSCTEFKCLVKYMADAQIDGTGITEDSDEDAVRALVGAGGYTIAREIKGRNHQPKVACDNCQQWLRDLGWKWAPGKV